MVNVDYNEIKVLFPEHFNKEPGRILDEWLAETNYPIYKQLQKIDKNILTFKFGSCVVQAKLKDYSIPIELSELSQVKKELIRPLAKKITLDLKTIEEPIYQLRELAKEGKVEKFLHFAKDDDIQPYFIVFDGSLETESLFEKLGEFAKTPNIIVRDEHIDIVDAAIWVNKFNDQFGIGGYSLKEAVERVHKIYTDIGKRVAQIKT